MSLMERVGTLLRANINDLIDRAQEPEKMVKQVVLDIENQLLQVKTQIAIGIADLHLLERKRDENQQRKDEWMRKAQVALSKQQEDLARAAIERSIESGNLAQSFLEQIEDQRVQLENLKNAFTKLDGKLTEARAKGDVLLARHRRGRSAGAAFEAQLKAGNGINGPVWDRLHDKVQQGEVIGIAARRMSGEPSVEESFRALEKQDEVERLLAELRSKLPA